MSARITREEIYTALRILNELGEKIGLPAYGLDIWSPGDGWTRYQLITANGHREMSRVCTRGEIYDVLYTLTRVLEAI